MSLGEREQELGMDKESEVFLRVPEIGAVWSRN